MRPKKPGRGPVRSNDTRLIGDAGTAAAPARSASVIYLLAVSIAAMWAYILWLTFRLRRDRVKTEREQTRGRFAFRPRDRMRFLLKRSFATTPDKPDWEDLLVSRLANVPADPPGAQPSARGAGSADLARGTGRSARS